MHTLGEWAKFTFSYPSGMGALAIAGKSAVIYLFLILGLRLLGKRELGQMSIYDLVLIIVLANSVQNALVGQDSSLVGGMIAALVLLIMNRGFTWLVVHSEKVNRAMVGEPVLIVRDGVPLFAQIRRQGLTLDHVKAAMREHGIGRIEDIQIAVLEVDGTISLVPKDAQVHRTRRHVKGLKMT